MKNILEQKGREISYFLRHGQKEFEQGLIDEHGWMTLDNLQKITHTTQETIDEIVNSNDKKRYEYNEDKTKIRARQGHSIPVNVELKEATDITPNNPYLYHGTSDRFIDNIKKQGLLPQSRLYVHLSKDQKTAQQVAIRHGGKNCIITINAYQMIQDGCKIYLSNNGVYNTKQVNTKYFVSINIL